MTFYDAQSQPEEPLVVVGHATGQPSRPSSSSSKVKKDIKTVHPQNVQLHKGQLQNVQLPKVHLPNFQSQIVQVTKRPFSKTSRYVRIG